MKHTVTELTLKNGLKGLVIQVPDADVLSFEISFRAGEFLLDRNKWETAHLLEHVMFGTNSSFKTAREFQAELEKNGAYSNASTSAYDVTYEVECAAFEADRVIGLVTGALAKPVFKLAEFKAEFGNVAEELELRSNNHFRTLNIALREALGFYTVNDQDRIKLMKNVTIDDIKNHYRQTHSVENARFIIAGVVSQKQLDALGELELVSKQARVSMPVETPKKLNKPVVILKKEVPNLYFYIDTYAVDVLDLKARDALSLLSTILTETLHSKLLGAAREKGLVYAMGSGQQHLRSSSSFWIGAQVSKRNVKELFDLTGNVIRIIKERSISGEELEVAKLYMQGKQARSAQTVNSLLGKYAHDYYQDDTIVEELSYNDRIQNISLTDVQEVVKLVTSGRWALGLLGNIDAALATELYAATDAVLHL